MTRRTPLYDRHVALGGRMVDFAGWEMPQQYSSVRAEHLAVRTAAGLFDVSHMGRMRVTGERAPESLNHLVTNDLASVHGGHAQYNLICNEAGGVLDDLILYRGEDGGWTIVYNAGNREKDVAWFHQHLTAVDLLDLSEMTGLLALQGPTAADLLAQLTDVDVTSLPYFGFAGGEVAGVSPVAIARTGYTGEDGFELFVDSDRVGDVWDALVERGAQPCGLAARDVCRLEAGLRLYGNDMDESTNPYEAGLGWTVKLDKGDFIGREALVRVRENGPERVIVGLRGRDRTIPRHGAMVRVDGREAGHVTSGTYSFFLNQGIGMAMVARGSAPLGTIVELEARGASAQAEVVKLPFHKGTAGGQRERPSSSAQR
jgi:aminomethyltransferase